MQGTLTVSLMMEPREGDEMRLRPVPPHERLMTPAMLRRMDEIRNGFARRRAGRETRTWIDNWPQDRAYFERAAAVPTLNSP